MAKKKEAKNEKNDLSRPPIVTVMGHVDHGKTTLVDKLRNSNIAGQEIGGITQHVRAFQIDWQGSLITFLDTPGHEAFSEMRARGSKLTDIILLVVAADDGVMPQTKEVINRALEDNIPMVVAINKIDLPNANIQKVKSELSQSGVLLEGWGGNTVAVEISAKTGQNIDQLMEMLILTGDLLDLKVDPNAGNFGTILETFTDKSRGNVAVTIVQNGVFKAGYFIKTSKEISKIRSMVDSGNKILKEAGSSTPISLLGLTKLTDIGDIVYVDSDKKKLGNVTEIVEEEVLSTEENPTATDILTMLFAQQDDATPILSVVLRADVAGSLEAITDSLVKASSDKVKIVIAQSGTGDITQSDIMYAKNTRSVVIGFNVNYPKNVEDVAKTEKVIVMKYNIIYELIDEVTQAAKGLIPQTIKLISMGDAEVLQVFKLSNGTTIAGSLVKNGKIVKNNHAAVERRGEKVFESKIANIRHVKDEVKEGVKGSEYGIALASNFEFEVGDKVICYLVEKS